MKIYLASSWRNTKRREETLTALRRAGHEVYDFTNPAPGKAGFSWQHLELGSPQSWTPAQYARKVLEHPVATAGFETDMAALRGCDACVLVLPCGRSAHLELGWAVGAGALTFVLLDEQLDEAELMYLMCDAVCLDVAELVQRLELEEAE